MGKEIKRIKLKSGKEKSIFRFHPWIFSGAIKEMSENIKEGELVHVYSSDDKFLAIGYYQPSSISIRIITFENQEINEKFWEDKFTKALKLRKELGLFNNENLNVFRLINAEGDGFPGLIIDYYNGILVFQAHSIGMYLNFDIFKKILLELNDFKVKAIYDKSSSTLPYKAQLKTKDSFIFGQEVDEIIVNEYGNEFLVNIVEGQKTGFFIDQRENRLLLKNFCMNKKVLNAFCYSGGFSVYALKGGASIVHSVDSSVKAISLTNKNISLNLNKLGKINHLSFEDDLFNFMDSLNEKYDVIILDPPAFAKHVNALNQGLKGYLRINKKAFEHLNPGGILFTFSCSQIVSKDSFKTTVMHAAETTKRNVKILYQLSQPPDHPVSIFHPEGEYLKGLVLLVG